jgi:acetoin utilization deacetylase AcuC-like enzyme
MSKYARLRARVLAEGIIASDDVIEAPAATWDELRLAHAAGYVQAVAAGTLPAEMQRRIGFPWSPAMVERSRRSSGASIAAARTALTEGVAANLAGGTHHAFVDRGEGYCVFNDVAVAARVLQRDLRCQRLAVVDCDVHQGNGTAAIFRDDPSVFTFSMHGAKNYPFRKEVSDLDVELADAMGDDEYLALLARHLPDVLARHRPALVFYLAGRRSVHRRPAGPAGALDRRPACARRVRVRALPRGWRAGGGCHERRLCTRCRRHRADPPEHDPRGRRERGPVATRRRVRCARMRHAAALPPPH